MHDLGVKFNSPFVNLWIEPNDYLKFLENMDKYIEQSSSMYFMSDKKCSYPVGVIDDISIYFMHYKNEEEAYNKWNDRINRIDKNNIFVMFTERNGCMLDHLLRFDRLPYNKVVFTHREYPQIESAFYLPEYKDSVEVGILLEYCNKYTWKKHYDAFDFVKWFNGNN